MDANGSELQADLDRALEATGAVVAAIRADQWSVPTPCTERALARSRRRLTARPQGPDAPFAAEVQVPHDAPAVDRLAGFLGREV